MKSALFATIFGIIAGVSILLTVPAEGKPPVIVIQPPKSFPDYGRTGSTSNRGDATSRGLGS
jgi:hypothetical protein